MYDLELDEQACRYYEFDYGRTITEDLEFLSPPGARVPGPHTGVRLRQRAAGHASGARRPPHNRPG